MTPIRAMASSTAPPAALITPLVSCAMGASPAPSQRSWCQAALAKAMATRAKKMMFMAWDYTWA